MRKSRFYGKSGVKNFFWSNRLFLNEKNRFFDLFWPIFGLLKNRYTTLGPKFRWLIRDSSATFQSRWMVELLLQKMPKIWLFHAFFWQNRPFSPIFPTRNLHKWYFSSETPYSMVNLVSKTFFGLTGSF